MAKNRAKKAAEARGAQSTLVAAIGSLCFYAGYLSSGILFGSLSLIVWPLPPVRRIHFFLIWQRFVILWLRLCCRITICVEGETPQRNCVILSQHQSQLDTFLLPVLVAPQFTVPVCKQSLLKIPFFGWGLRCIWPIVINRQQTHAAYKNLISEGIKRLQAKLSVIVYPEGSRYPPGQLGRFLRGGAGLAIKHGAPIVPVALNTGLKWPARRFIKYPGEVKIIFGEMIEHSSGTAKEITRRARDWVVAQQDRAQ